MALIAILKFLLVFLSVLELAVPARILCIYTVPFDSHQSVFQILTEELAKKGHNLTVLTPLPTKEPIENVTQIDVHNLSYTMWEENFPKSIGTHRGISIDAITFWNAVYATMYPILEAQLSVPEMQDIIKDEKQHFDIILIESCIRPTLIISARFNAPVVMVSSFLGNADNYYTLGATTSPVFFPDYNVKSAENGYLWDRLLSFYMSARLRLKEWQMEQVENTMIRKHFGGGAPTMSELRKNVQMLLLNVHHVWDHNRPVPFNVLYLGALHLKAPKPLRRDLKTILDSSEHGVIYMSLGSKIKSSELPLETLRAIVNVFASLPYDVIWKWDGDHFLKTPKNVQLKKWLPQNDMLHHPKLKAFITQGGLQSTDEAIAAGVPLIGLPIFADQETNVQKYQLFGIGVGLDINSLNEKEFRQAIIDVAEKTKYPDNIKKLSHIMKEQRNGSLERALRWIGFIATHQTHQLRSPLANLSVFQYYMLDIFLPMTFSVFMFIVFIVIVLKNVFLKLICMTNENKVKAE